LCLNRDEHFDEESAPDDLSDRDDGLTRLMAVDVDAAAPVRLRGLAALTLGPAPRALRVARTADRHRAFARAWLFEQLRPSEESSES
jgi:hypothetical protein